MAAPSAKAPTDHLLRLLAAVSTNHREGDNVEHLLRIVLDSAAELDLGVRGVAAHVLRRTAIVSCGNAGIPDHEAESARVLPLIAPLPATDCARLGIPVLLGHPGEIDRHYPGLLAGGMSTGIQAIASVPVDRDTRTVGALTLAYDRPVDFDDGHIAALRTLGRICAPMSEFDHHETRSGPIIERIDDPTRRSSNAADDSRIAELEQRIARLEQLIGFVAGTVAQHLDG
ncbi:MAG: GAF domain-containing protein [Ilumatobacteraceae bacterium]